MTANDAGPLFIQFGVMAFLILAGFGVAAWGMSAIIAAEGRKKGKQIDDRGVEGAEEINQPEQRRENKRISRR